MKLSLKLVLSFALILSSLPAFGQNKEKQCSPKLEAYVGEAAVYRKQNYDAGIKKCIPGIHSLIAVKDSDLKQPIWMDGFVVGIEKLWNSQLEDFYKFTFKAGPHTTVVKLFTLDQANKKFLEVSGATFVSSIASIDLLHSTSDKFQVQVRNGSTSGNCRVVSEETFALVGKQFQSKGKKEVEKVCE